MAASAADVRSILSLPSSTAGPSQPQPKKPTAPSTRKPEGISRELFALIGPSAPSIAAQLAKPRLKQKPTFGGGGKVKWEFRSFKNGARSDGLELGHWVKASTDPSAEYPFMKYNVQPTAYTYSQDEYTRFLEDNEWTKEETDYLFKIVREYDLRWYIVHDRYDYPDGAARTLEDLKDRYYSVCRKLVRNRSWAGDDASKNALLVSFQFDKEREMTRKKYVASLESRTPEQISEEEALYVEIKRLEQNERRFKRERDELLRTLLGVESGLPDIVGMIDDEGPMGGSAENGGKRRRRGTLDTPMTPSNVISLGPPAPRRAQSAKSAAYDALHCIIRTDPPTTTTTATKAAHQPVHLRSFKLPVPKPAIAQKVSQAMAELGIPHVRLVMPTRENCAQLESLLDATSALVETKKVVDRVDQEIRILKARLGRKASEGGADAEADPDADGDADADGETNTGTGTGAATPMNVDDGEGDPGRAQSVVSTRSGRSGRSRKQTRRSLSVSSIETSASFSTRGGRKKQKRT